MKCPNCGQENRDMARFCQHCGASLAQEPAPERVETAAVEEAPVADEAERPEEEALLVIAPVESQAATEPAESERAESESAPEPDAGEAVESEPAPEPVESEPVEREAAPELVAVKAAECEPAPETVAVKAVESEPAPEPVEVETLASETAEPEPAPEPIEGEPVPEAVETAAAEPAASATDRAPAPDEEGEMEQPLDSAEDQEDLLPVEPGPEALPPPEAEEVPADALLWREEPEPLPPLEPGTIVSGRYRVIEVELAEGDENRYQVRDLQRCPQCGHDQNSPDEAFCASCGAMLDQKPVASMVERPAAAAEEAVEVEFEDHFVESGRAYWVWREGIETGPLEEEASLRPQIGYRSDTGRARELDEDSLFIADMSSTYEAAEQTLALFIVADGMGGHEGGEVASKVAIRTMAELLMHTVFIPELSGRPLLPEQLLDWMRKATEAANDRVYMERRERRNDMGTTLTAALVKGADLYLAHVGDCRAYRWNERGLGQLTTDHSIIASMVASGNARPEEIYTHPQRSVIYRAIGDQPQVQVDTQAVSLFAGDRILICSDGLWEMVREDGIEEVMLRETDPQRACELLVDQANAAGGLDNISVIIVQF